MNSKAHGVVETGTREDGPAIGDQFGREMLEEIKIETGANATLPRTKAEYDSALQQLAAIVKVDHGFGSEGRWFGFAYATGLLRIKFPSGNIIIAQAPDLERAIRSFVEIAIDTGRMSERVFGFSTDPRIEVHRVPVNCKGRNICDWAISIGLD